MNRWRCVHVYGEDPRTSLLLVGVANPGSAPEECTRSRVLRGAACTGMMVATPTRLAALCLCLTWRGDLTGWMGCLGCLAATAANLFKLLMKYRPEDKAEKKERLMAKAVAEKDGKTLESKKPICVKFGLNHVTYLIEQVCQSSIKITPPAERANAPSGSVTLCSLSERAGCSGRGFPPGDGAATCVRTAAFVFLLGREGSREREREGETES